MHEIYGQMYKIKLMKLKPCLGTNKADVTYSTDRGDWWGQQDTDKGSLWGLRANDRGLSWGLQASGAFTDHNKQTPQCNKMFDTLTIITISVLTAILQET